ncbi:MAG: TonB-dependent receptor, partial [Pseudomonadota bacterium]
LYQPEEAENYDLGLLMQKSNLIGRDDLLAKITYFDTSVDNVLETLNSDPSNPLTQVGTETRDGIEVEMNYQRERSSFNISYSKINGEQKGYWVENSNLPGLSFQDVTKQSRPIYDIPGDTLSLAANYVFYEFNLDVGWRGSFVGKRKVLSEAGSRDATEVTLDSYAVHDIFANWRPFKNSQFSNSVFRFGIDNVTNKRYQLNEEDTAGSFSVARNVKMTFDLNF